MWDPDLEVLADCILLTAMRKRCNNPVADVDGLMPGLHLPDRIRESKIINKKASVPKMLPKVYMKKLILEV